MVAQMSIANALFITITLSYCFHSVFSFANSVRLSKNAKRAYNRPKITKRGKCIHASEGVQEYCRDFNANSKTYFPNILKNSDLQQTIVDLREIWPLVGAQCSPDTKRFLCSVFFPQCTDKKSKRSRMLLPCRSLCESVKDACEGVLNQHGASWPPAFRCDAFPPGGGCLQKSEDAVYSSAEREDVNDLFRRVIEKEQDSYEALENETETDYPVGEQTVIKKEVNANRDIYISIPEERHTAKEGDFETSSQTTAFDKEPTEEDNRVEKTSPKILKHFQVENDVFITVVGDDEVQTGSVRREHRNNTDCKGFSNHRVETLGEDLKELPEPNRGPTECMKGRMQCRDAPVKSYLNGVLHCCFYQRDILHTVTVDRTSWQPKLKSSCKCL